ncbi:hypothetical protein N7527_009947 [Penicillium freii]|nr:hypothetical protein N7527_009947 [Penicillium freii]
MPSSMSLSHLPAELVYIIAKFIKEARYLNSLVQTCWRLHGLLNPILYQTGIHTLHGFPLVWGAKHSSEVTIRRAFDAGASTHTCHYNLKQSLVAAVDNSHETIVRLILEQSRDRSVFKSYQSCNLCECQRSIADIPRFIYPLDLAIVRGNAAIVRLLLAYKITFKYTHRCCGSVYFDLVFAAVKHGHLAVLQVIIEARDTLNDE